MGHNLGDFTKIICAIARDKFIPMSDDILNGGVYPLRLHRDIHFIDKPIHMQANRAFDCILNRNHTVLYTPAINRTKNVRNEFGMLQIECFPIKKEINRLV
ncbi:hypothetical protein D3C75_1248350 [compost metagenome]